ncbi:hypothetical protein JHD50_02680 [Sulfurimonas sp. MAG313]|nr:conjugal transfer protein TraF [Sulfurimonas sp. MAG313]MDF1880216.1 hypothetical protein [Sulfurimonas sp. MAG313]
MKKVILLSLCGASMLMAGFSEHAYLYKDARIMGMGGASVAVGGLPTAVFYNPAGLRDIAKDDGLVVELFGLSAQASDNFGGFSTDLNDANDEQEISDVLKEYSGENFSAFTSNYSSVSMNMDTFAWSVGVLAAGDVNLIPHGNGGANDLLETRSRGYGGLIVGLATSFEDLGPGTLDVGVSAKYISQVSYEGGIGITEIINNQDDLGTYLQDKYEKKSSGLGVDLGMNYKLFPENYWHLALGLSVLNIGDLKMDSAYGRQPMTVNIGASISPELPFFEHFTFAMDYVDLLNANETRFYDFTQVGGVVTNVTYQDFSESDFMKRLRLGVSAGVFENSWFMATINAGMYQSEYTLGFDLQATIVKLSAATYAEEIGPESGQLVDRRYVVYVGIGW